MQQQLARRETLPHVSENFSATHEKCQNHEFDELCQNLPKYHVRLKHTDQKYSHDDTSVAAWGSYAPQAMKAMIRTVSPDNIYMSGEGSG